MIDSLTTLIRYAATLVFGCSVSAAFLGLLGNRKNRLFLASFCLIDLILQSGLFYLQGRAAVVILYPLVTHLPLLLFYILLFKRKILSSILAITLAYLCCQTANWISVFAETLGAPGWAVNLIYGLTLLPACYLVLRFLLPLVSSLLAKPHRSILSFCVIPVSYYIFDYAATSYTKLLYSGNILMAEFVPFLLCISYLLFCAMLYQEYEEKQQLENYNRLMRARQEQSEKETAAMLRQEKAVSLLRHNMRHFLSTISSYIDSGENDQAQEYIREVIGSVDKTMNLQYCANKIVNMILSSYEDAIRENDIDLRCCIRIPKTLPFSDVDVTSILSNALENAIHAVLPLPKGGRIIELNLIEKNDKILLSLSNTYAVKPRMVDGLPVSDEEGHGFGTQSILYTTGKLKGNCLFSVTEERFVLQVVI